MHSSAAHRVHFASHVAKATHSSDENSSLDGSQVDGDVEPERRVGIPMQKKPITRHGWKPRVLAANRQGGDGNRRQEPPPYEGPYPDLRGKNNNDPVWNK